MVVGLYESDCSLHAGSCVLQEVNPPPDIKLNLEDSFLSGIA